MLDIQLLMQVHIKVLVYLLYVKFVFPKKAKKIDEMFTIDLTLVAILDNMDLNFDIWLHKNSDPIVL